jgi:hypothetical protein
LGRDRRDNDHVSIQHDDCQCKSFLFGIFSSCVDGAVERYAKSVWVIGDVDVWQWNSVGDFLNDTIALIFTPLILNLSKTLRLNPIPYLLAMAGATNVGSVAALSGNPQNILIGSFSGIGYLELPGQ